MYCPDCPGNLKEYSDKVESWIEHIAPFRSIFRGAESLMTGIKITYVLRCDSCKKFAFQCPHCSGKQTSSNLYTSGTKTTCPNCKEDLIIMNPSTIISLK